VSCCVAVKHESHHIHVLLDMTSPGRMTSSTSAPGVPWPVTSLQMSPGNSRTPYDVSTHSTHPFLSYGLNNIHYIQSSLQMSPRNPVLPPYDVIDITSAGFLFHDVTTGFPVKVPTYAPSTPSRSYYNAKSLVVL